MLKSKWPGRTVQAGLGVTRRREIRVRGIPIQLAEVHHLGIRLKTMVSNTRMLRMFRNRKVLTKGITDMMMAIRLWREPDIRDMTMHWETG